MTSTTQLISMLTIMVIINISLSMYQESIDSYTVPHTNMFNVATTPYGNMTTGGGTDINMGDELYPYAGDDANSGNLFTDTFSSFLGWIKSTSKIFGSILSQPMGFLKNIGIPWQLYVPFGVLWYLIALILIISWIGGR